MQDRPYPQKNTDRKQRQGKDTAPRITDGRGEIKDLVGLQCEEYGQQNQGKEEGGEYGRKDYPGMPFPCCNSMNESDDVFHLPPP
jgi:hypothetical protein